MYVEKRSTPLPYKGCVVAALAVMISLLVGGGIFLAQGINPFTAYAVMLSGALGTVNGLTEIVVKAIPLTLTGLSVVVAATMLLWNIGGEGQFVWGAIGAGWAALYLSPFLPPPLVLPACFVCGAAAGAFWAAIPATLKIRFGVSEILSTLLLNYVAIIVLEHLYFGPWRDPMAFGFPGTPIFPETAWLPRIAKTRIHPGAVVAVVATVVLHVALSRSKWGYQLRVTGKSREAARYAGINTNRQTFWVLALAGAFAGLAGMGEVCGLHYILREGIHPGYGYAGIIVACLAGMRPILVPVWACVLGAFLIGADHLQASMQLSTAIGLVLEGALLLGLLIAEAATRYKISFSREENKNG